MQFTFQHTAEIEVFPDQLVEVELTVTAEYTPFSRGSRGAHGEPEEPDEPEEINIISVVDSTGRAYDGSEMVVIMENAWSYVEDNHEKLFHNHNHIELYKQ